MNAFNDHSFRVCLNDLKDLSENVRRFRWIIFAAATSALDNITQKAVSDSIGELNCTRIVIAHRLSTIQNCDRIVCLDKGSIVEQGTYEELIQKNGFFAELIKKQQI